MIRRVFSSLPWVLLAQVRGQCPSWSEGLVQLGGGASSPDPEWCWAKKNEADCVKSFVFLNGKYAKCEYKGSTCTAAPERDREECPDRLCRNGLSRGPQPAGRAEL